jgi:hypothetical protein
VRPRRTAARAWTANPGSGYLDSASFFARQGFSYGYEEILDLALCVAVFLGLGRTLTVLGVDQSCAIDL